jgi:hypothetical protein
MKCVRLLATGMLIAAIFASGNYWFSHFSKPASLPLAVIPREAQSSLDVTAARNLFGKRVEMLTRRDYKLTGVIFSGAITDRMAIISVDREPAAVVRLGGQLQAGVTLKEVHRFNIILSIEHGDLRVDFPRTAQAPADNYALVENPEPVQVTEAGLAVNQAEEAGRAESPAAATRPAPWGLSRPDPVPGIPAVIRAAPPVR